MSTLTAGSEGRSAPGQGPGADEPLAPSGVRRRPGDKRGLGKVLFDLRHRRWRSRQAVGIAFIVVLTLLGRPYVLGLALGAALALAGMVVRMWASGFVLKNEVLATTGPYAYVRHPLYVGNVLICVGFVLACGTWWSGPLALALLLYYYPHTIHYEDEKLRRLFPGQWERWASEVRALVPRLAPYRATAQREETSWSLRLSMARNGEPLHVVLLLVCLGFLYWKLG